MPLVRIEMLEGRTIKQKEALVEAITDALVEIAEVPKEHIWVILGEFKKDNWATGGVLLSQQP